MICVSATETNAEKLVALVNASEMSEVRIDMCQLDEQAVRTLFPRFTRPVIATCRPQLCPDALRVSLLQAAIESGASYVDVEIEADAQIKQALIAKAREHHCSVIVSYHNYEETPDSGALHRIVEQCYADGADIAKIATTARTESDTARVLSLYADFPKLVALAMGEKGRISRIANLFLGSPFTFVSAGEGNATAPGQFTEAQMGEILQRLK